MDRKQDARKKIMLGGLFVKAGFDHYYPHDPATLYGMLLYCKNIVKNKPEVLSEWKKLGKVLIESK
jgi:hypothetical protein